MFLNTSKEISAVCKHRQESNSSSYKQTCFFLIMQWLFVCVRARTGQLNHSMHASVHPPTNRAHTNKETDTRALIYATHECVQAHVSTLANNS